MRDTFIAVHASAALLAFGAGARLVFARRQRLRAPGVFPVYLCALALMALALFVAVALDWSHLSAATRTTFAVLCGLAAAMVYVGGTAGRTAGPRFVEPVGFTLVALFDGFAIIAAFDAGAPGWAIAVVGVAGVMIGRRVISLARSRADQRIQG